MRITASHIVNWANTRTKEAQVSLPRWVRRLCFDPEMTRQLAFPAGDSTYVPGWDGILFSESGNAWVPAGSSRWEIGCDQNVQSKANSDYLKRVEQTSEEERSICTFVFVTPRRWTKKSDWIAEQLKKGEWADIRAYDADDLEQWLEQTPAVALQFAEELGLSGWGVVGLTQYWNSWAKQCDPFITPEALFLDRSEVLDTLIEKIQATGTSSDPSRFLVLRADSVEEAAAFSVAAVMTAGNLQDRALVVTEPDGWRYVEANPQLQVVIAAHTETAIHPVLRPDLQVIIPHAIGDIASKHQGNELTLERPNIYEFEKALIAIGVEESDAKRYALSNGRSWTAFRRQRATNPAIRRPSWLDTPQATCLSLLCLLGAWYSNNDEDRKVVERLADRPYEEVERDLRHLLQLDDSPILNIGDVWKAKSPLELLSQCGATITSSQLNRFFTIAQEMLSAPDPQLELPEKDRWMAQIHGKVHPYSGLLFESVCDSLMKLSVRGSEQPGLSALNIEERVASLIHTLLDKADDQRWLSLASYLPTLAEAAPDEFLRAINSSLRMVNQPVTRLITETSDSGLNGRCWHAGLLWALETLAWAPRRLAPVALILVELCHVPIQGNWDNKPSSSLFGLFRTWMPQTAASVSERIKVLKLLIEKDSEVAFSILLKLAESAHQTASPAERPKWREDDAGAGHGATGAEIYEMFDFARESLPPLCDGNTSRIVSLLQHSIFGDKEDLPKALSLLEPFTHEDAKEEEREALYTELRQIIHRHYNYNESPSTELKSWLEPLESCYERLAPRNLIIRYRWLFNSHWLELPRRDVDEDSDEKTKIIKQLRSSALNRIYQAHNVEGIENLINACAEPSIVGSILAETTWENICWSEWLSTKGGDFHPNSNMTNCITGFLRAIPQTSSRGLLQAVISSANQHNWSAPKLARFLVLARPERQTWELAKDCGSEVFSTYWQTVQPYLWGDDKDANYVMEQLLGAKRPVSALNCCRHSLNAISPNLLFNALQQVLNGQDESGQRIEQWHLVKYLERLEQSDEIEKMALIHLEFGLFPLLRYGREAKAEALYNGITSEPKLFTELICLLFKPEHGDQPEPMNADSRALAERSWDILQSCKRLPGTQPDGTIDENAFTQFIRATRELCRQADRLTMCDQTLGQILAYSPEDEDGTWPISPVREALEDPELEQMRKGFSIETFNKRGVTTRSAWDGGDQERNLAAYYLNQAERVQFTHPNVSAMLEDIAKQYERHGKREDIEARLRKESF